MLGCAEAWILADELAEADVGVVLSPVRATPLSWSARRAHPGPPLASTTAFALLHSAGVRVAIAPSEEWVWTSRQILLELGWAYKLAEGVLSRKDAVALATSSIEEMLGLEREEGGAAEFMAYEGDALNGFEAKLVAAASPVGLGGVEFFP